MGSTVYCCLENLVLHIQMGTFIYFQTFRKSVHYYLFCNLVIYFGFIVLMKIDPALDKSSTYYIVGLSSVKLQNYHIMQFALLKPNLSPHQVTHFKTDLRPHRAARMGLQWNPLTKTDGLKTGSDQFSQFGQSVRTLPEILPSTSPGKTQVLRSAQSKTDLALCGLATREA